jgi:hypothetical protein
MNAQKITGLADPSSNQEAVTVAYLNTVLANYRPYYSFSISIGDVPSGIESYTSTDGVITNVTYTNVSGSEGFYTCTVNSPAVFGGADYYIIYGVRSLRGSVIGFDNDLWNPITQLYSKTSFTIYMEENSGSVQNIAVDGILVRRTF